MRNSTRGRKIAAWSAERKQAHADRIAQLLATDPDYFKKLALKRKASGHYHFQDREAARQAGRKGLDKRYRKERDGSAISTSELQ